MRVKRIICPACNSEEKITLEEKNLHEYSEEIVSEPCKECRDIPEVRLLEAIFGRGQNGGQNALEQG